MKLDDVVQFSAAIYQIGENRCVDVPGDIMSRAGVEVRPHAVPVVITVGGRSVKTNLLPRGGGRYRVFINSKLRRAAAADTGDRIDVEMRLDLADREPDIPPDLEIALKAAGPAWHQFENLTVNQRREMTAYVQAAHLEGTRVRRIARILEVLEEKRPLDLL